MEKARLSLIFSPEDISRISITVSDMGCTEVVVDVHGMKCCEARRFINNIIVVANMDCHLVIIHGYNHGTAIKEMLSQSFNNRHIYERFPDPYNQGVTHMSIAA